MNRIAAGVAASLTLAAMAVPAAGTARADSYQSFQSPSGNIDCGLFSMDNDTVAMCEIRDHTWAPPPRPSPCMGGFGDRISLVEGSAPKMACHTDTVRGPGHPTLQYGQTQSIGPISCDSEPSGITCTDASTGHYFLLARDNYELH
ncbi:DUF6636 domain-containing protein [Mycobacterium sp. E3198]|uniref:DUF6636 domain-containing protein n=1 Tax=Mycobacterium sp. E3198 TaxID=1834143 RepID=UPI0007FDFCDE|nr:DUF6636 domain-containing protein [Mycobacterium sp. E3198]OBG41287.1 hypothetical protein A5673_02115 [Mycobacterium sp. E3198]